MAVLDDIVDFSPSSVIQAMVAIRGSIQDDRLKETFCNQLTILLSSGESHFLFSYKQKLCQLPPYTFPVEVLGEVTDFGVWGALI